MTAKEYLQQIYIIQRKLKRLEARREDIRNDLYAVGSSQLNPVHVQTSMTGDKMAELVARVDEVEREIIQEIQLLTETKQRIISEIESMQNENYKQLLFDRYILCKKWEWIALDRDKGVRWIFRMHGKALNAFEKSHKNIESDHCKTTT